MQKLHCPGCGMVPFTRVGSLISHIESGECRISTKDIESMKEAKLSFMQRLEELTQEPVKSNFAKFVTPQTTVAWPDAPEPSNNDTGWSDADFPVLPACADAIKVNKRPNDEVSEIPFSGAWGTSDIAAAINSTSKAVQPTAEQLEAATASGPRMADGQMDIDDPSHPLFNAARYYCEIIEKYNCPKVGCG